MSLADFCENREPLFKTKMQHFKNQAATSGSCCEGLIAINDFYWRQKSSSLNVVQYNTTIRPSINHL